MSYPFLVFNLDSGELLPTIIDFGMGSMNEEDATLIPGFRYTNHDTRKGQTAPEIFFCGWTNSRSDVYGLGKIIEDLADILPDRGLKRLARKMREELPYERPTWKEICQAVNKMTKASTTQNVRKVAGKISSRPNA